MRTNRGVLSLLPPILAACLLICPTPGLAGAAVPAPGSAVRSGCEYDYPPFCLVDDGGRADGFSVDLLRAALRTMNRDVSFRVGPWTEIKTLLERGEIDALPLVGRTPERESVFDFTFPYLSLRGAIVVKDGTTGIRGLNDLKGRQVAVMTGDNAEELLRRTDFGCKIHATETFRDALRELSEGRHDAVVIQRLLALRLIQTEGITNLRIIDRPLKELRQDFCFAVREGDREMLALLNEGLALVMADGTFDKLQEKWFATLELPSDDRIVIGGDSNYPPYEFLDENQIPIGYNVDLTSAIARKTGLDIEIRLGTWENIKEGLANGEIDAVHGMFYSPERKHKFDFSPPHTVIQHVAVAREGEGEPPAQLADLKGKQIVVMQGDIMHDWAKDMGIEDQVTAVPTQAEALEELAKGEYDCALVARLPAMYWIKKKGWDNLIVADLPLLTPEYCYAVPLNRKILLAKLSEGLSALHASDEYRAIYKKWLGVYEDTPPSFAVILRYAAIIGSPLLLLLIASLIWSRTLRRQVSRRTAELSKSEEKFRDSEIKARSILNASHSATALIDRNGIVLDCNLTYAAQFGLTNNTMRGRCIWDLFPPEALESRRRKISSVFETGEPLRGEETVGGVWNAYHLEPVTNEKGEVTAVVLEALDITSWKESEENLGLNKKLLRDVMDLVPAFICAKNLEGRFLLVNKKLADFYGHTVEEMTDMLHSDLCADENELRSMLTDDHEVIKAGGPRHIPEETMKNPDGSISVLDTYKIPFTAYDEPAVLITSSDITERKQAEQSLEKLSNSLEEQVKKKTEELQDRITKSEQSRRAMLYMVEDLNKTHRELQESRERAIRSERLATIGVLAGGVAHELRNSLGVLTNVAAYLNIAVPAENETVALNLRHMRDNVVRANRIITDLLDFSRDTAPNRSELLISNLIDDLLKEIDLPENITIERIHPKKSLQPVLADRDQILLIIRNLLTNAIDAMSLPYLDPPGGVITLDYAPTEDDDWILKVTDTGIGIPAEKIDLIFEPLFTSKSRGIGLGLALSLRKAMSNGGSLTVESEVGVGSTFILTLLTQGITQIHTDANTD